MCSILPRLDRVAFITTKWQLGKELLPMLPVLASYYIVLIVSAEPAGAISQTTITTTIAELKLHVVDHRICSGFLLHDAGLQDNVATRKHKGNGERQ